MLVRPLYAYFVGIALAAGRFEASWDQTELLDFILTHYSERKWPRKETGEPFEIGDDHPALFLAVVATILRQLRYENIDASWPGPGGHARVEHLQALGVVGAAKSHGVGDSRKPHPVHASGSLGRVVRSQAIAVQT